MARQCTRVSYGMHTLGTLTGEQLNRPQRLNRITSDDGFLELRNVKAGGPLGDYTVARTFERVVSFLEG